MNNLETIIDYGSNNLRIGVFNQLSEKIYSSKVKISDEAENQNLEKSLDKLIREAEKKISGHLVDASILYDTAGFNFIDLSIKKTFDQPTLIKKHYDNLVDEAKFIITENNFKDQIIHTVITDVIVDNNEKKENIFEEIKIKSLILEIKYICLNKSVINDISKQFKKNNLNILNIYCSSYVKSFFYKKDFENSKNIIFIDIGFERSTALFYKNSKFQFINSKAIGGNNITKDISKIFKLNDDYSEDLKEKFTKDENEFSLSKNISNKNNLYLEIKEKKISTKLLKQIIEARLDEIVELTVIKDSYFKKIYDLQKPKIIFLGSGSKLLSNTLNLETKKFFSELVFKEDDDSKICTAGINYHTSEERSLTWSKKKPRKLGFFESFFNLFSK